MCTYLEGFAGDAATQLASRLDKLSVSDTSAAANGAPQPSESDQATEQALGVCIQPTHTNTPVPLLLSLSMCPYRPLHRLGAEGRSKTVTQPRLLVFNGIDPPFCCASMQKGCCRGWMLAWILCRATIQVERLADPVPHISQKCACRGCQLPWTL